MWKRWIAVSVSAMIASAAHAAGAVETLPSGVKVEITREGTGAQPSATDVVKVRYRGTLADGTEFDNSEKHGGVATFPLNRVIPCWTQGVQKLRVGGKAKLTCPPETAYGSRGIGPIPPNSTLNFEVELVDIVK
ncbi:FKBP-type peptidyl-prolyl cis-trans isomerase FkpA [Trinickia symbiotica]|uniref:Peptidyl-prolyl cis-trans isomerase n=1 Tax=Trinickia symbiotica TaxID=863227 RepID=A0A2N7X6X7_9BURK|nr:FKBP-type peptidyl-prolyl cis-trans isomerase [Trinickia symbiotica]PPK42837.1 FKBP-type peptidyl-prolyl cis-trans isomerase FkpA [Trinickia symbiotica]